MTRSPFYRISCLLSLAAAAVALAWRVLRPIVYALVSPVKRLVDRITRRAAPTAPPVVGTVQARAFLARWVRRQVPRVYPQWRMCPSA